MHADYLCFPIVFSNHVLPPPLFVSLSAIKRIYHFIEPQLFSTWDFEMIRIPNIKGKLNLIFESPLESTTKYK